MGQEHPEHHPLAKPSKRARAIALHNSQRAKSAELHRHILANFVRGREPAIEN
jgi:hypothetical protein